MESIVKAFLGTFFILLISFLGLGLISASISMRNAQCYASTVATEIRSSNYMESIAALCEEEAKENGYVLTTEIHKSNDGGTKYGNLSLDYEIKVPFLNIVENRKIVMGI